MKLSLGPVRVALSVAALAVGVAFASGCAGSVQSAAAPVVGTTTVTSAAIRPSALAPAAWDADADESSAPAPIAVPTWGTAVVAAAPAK
jgi:hypothetical protein